MKQRMFFLLLAALLLSGCSDNLEQVLNEDIIQEEKAFDFDNVGETEKLIVLGDKLENPYSIENMQKAYNEIMLTRSGESTSNPVTVTDLYVRFLPKDSTEYYFLNRDLELELFDRPLDQEVVEGGTYYHDPSLPEDQITWQYATVSHDFVFPSVKFEILEECFIPRGEDDIEDEWDDDEEQTTRSLSAGQQFLEALELRAIENSGILQKMPAPEAETRGLFSRKKPQGTITVYDKTLGKSEGVKGVKVRCNLVVKWTSAYTDNNGYYKMPHSFIAGPFYELIFTNNRGFDIWGETHVIPLVGAAELLMGFHNKKGYSRELKSGSSWKWATINNAAADYYDMCGQTGIRKPPSNLKIWSWSAFGSSAPMLRRINTGVTFKSSSDWSNFFSNITVLPASYLIMNAFRRYIPDITIGLDTNKPSDEIYKTTCHELAHASHFSQVGSGYWQQYISFIMTYGSYGEQKDYNSGYCGIGEMWGYAMGYRMMNRKYSQSNLPSNVYWFKPRIIYELINQNVLTEAQIYACLTKDVTNHQQLKDKMILRTSNSNKQQQIRNIFQNYGY